MMEKRRARAALSVVAAVAGTGYASGRELVLFFAQLGRLSWAGILLASTVFGALVGLMSCASALRRWYGRVAAALRGLLLAAVAAVMLLEAGKLGALTLPARNGFLWGMLLALLLCANAAIARGGRQLLAQALPVVLLSARWGLAGFWMTALFSYVCAAATLAAALDGLWELAKRRPFLVDRGQA